MPNILDTADATREVWELDDAELDSFDDPFDDDEPILPPVLTSEQLSAQQDILRADAVEYLNADAARRAVWQAVTFLPATEVKAMMQAGADAAAVLKSDRDARKLHDGISLETRRDMRQSILDASDGLDVVEICHARGDALHDFDNVAALLGYHTNTWSDNRARDGREKRRKQSRANGAAASRVQSAVAAQKTAPPIPASMPPDSPNRENYRVALEDKWMSDAAPDCTPNPILSDADSIPKVDSIFAPKGQPKTKGDMPPGAPNAAETQNKAAAKADRIATFRSAFAMPRTIVLDALYAAQKLAPNAVSFEIKRANFFYEALEQRAARDPTFDYAAQAQKYQAARLRSLSNAVKESK